MHVQSFCKRSEKDDDLFLMAPRFHTLEQLAEQLRTVEQKNALLTPEEVNRSFTHVKRVTIADTVEVIDADTAERHKERVNDLQKSLRLIVGQGIIQY